jgi:hypothetical protein
MAGVLFLKTWQALGGIEAGRTATVVIVAFVALLITAGCRPEKPPVEKPPVVVTAGDIAVCRTEGDEATAKLGGGIAGALLRPFIADSTSRLRPTCLLDRLQPRRSSVRLRSNLTEF